MEHRDYRTTLSPKSVTGLTCYDIDIHRQILIVFGRNVTNKISIQKLLKISIQKLLNFLTSHTS